MKNVPFAMVSLALMITGFAGCGDVKEKVGQAKDVIKYADLSHTWQEEACKSSTLLGKSYRTQYVFSGPQVRKITQFFSAPECQDLAASATYSGVAEKKEEIQSNVHQIDMTFTSAVVVPLNETGKNFLNTLAFCGIKQWTVNTPADVTAHSSDLKCLNTRLPETVSDIYTIENDALLFGKRPDRSALGQRPSQINRDERFHRL